MMSLLGTWFGRGLDEVDRVNGFWSVLVLTLCSLGSFLIRYITQPMSCYVPPDLIKPLLTRVAMCDFEIPHMQNKQLFSLQRAFPITEIYEKIYVFLWYWIFLVGVATFFNLLLWAGFLFIPFLRNSKISAYINAALGPANDSSSITRFISSSLGLDGVLLMSMISQNSSEMVAANLSQEMFELFLEKEQQQTPSCVGSPITAPDSGDAAMVNVEGAPGNEEKETMNEMTF